MFETFFRRCGFIGHFWAQNVPRHTPGPFHPMDGSDRRRLPRDSLGLGLSSLLQASPNLPFHPVQSGRSWPRVGVAGNAPGTSISRLLRSSATTSSEAGQCGNEDEQGSIGIGEPQNPAGRGKPQRLTMGETLGRGRRERGNEGDIVACPEISMGGVFNRDPYQGTGGTTSNEALGPEFWKLERTTLVSREPPTAEGEYGTMAPSQGDRTSPKQMSNNANGLFGSTPALSRVLRIASDTCKSVYNM